MPDWGIIYIQVEQYRNKTTNMQVYHRINGKDILSIPVEYFCFLRLFLGEQTGVIDNSESDHGTYSAKISAQK